MKTLATAVGLMAIFFSISAFSQTKDLQYGVLSCALIDYNRKISERLVQSSVDFDSDRIFTVLEKEKLTNGGSFCGASIRTADALALGDIKVTVTNSQGVSAHSRVQYGYEDKVQKPKLSVSVGRVSCVCEVVKAEVTKPVEQAALPAVINPNFK